MTREQYLKDLIKENGFTIKGFAHSINMPYSTLLTMLNDGKIGSAAVDSVIRICQGLNITIHDLQSVQESASLAPLHLVLSQHEKLLIQRYREKKSCKRPWIFCCLRIQTDKHAYRLSLRI